jgi:undecaprenyl-diphosphatase
LVQGILEWLPISSEGQLVLLALWLDEMSEDAALSLAFWLHLGTMFAVILTYKSLWRGILDPRTEDNENLRSFLFFTTLGTGIVGVPIRLLLFEVINLQSVAFIVMWIIGFALIFTGILIHYSRKSDGMRELSDLSVREQLIVGFWQGLTIIPGISRSGTTISALLFLRVKPLDSFKGSFLMAVPAILGAVVLDVFFSLHDNESLFSELQFQGIALGVITAFITGFYSMKVLLIVAHKHDFSKIAISMGLIIIIILISL